MKAAKLKLKLLAGHCTNWRYADALLLARHCGWELTRTNGSHQILRHTDPAVATLNLQQKDGQAKAYQMKQLKEEIELSNL